jgi:uncharacterized protein
MTQPTAPSKQRIALVDSLRGFAIFGILFINLPFMALPGEIVHNPTLLNETGINYQLWHKIFWPFYGSQRAMFSLLFGASVLLFIQSKSKDTDMLRVSDLFYRRQIWLIVFGLINVYILLWDGDIIFDYGCYGLLLFVFRNLSPKKLLIAAAVCALIMIARENWKFFQDKNTIIRGEQISLMDTSKTKLNPFQQNDLEAMQELKKSSTRESKLRDAEHAKRMLTASYADAYKYKTDGYVEAFMHYTVYAIWDVLLFMFAGMAFLKLGWLSGNASSKIYWWMMLVGLPVGLTINYFRLELLQSVEFSYYDYIKQLPFDVYEIGRIFRSIGWFGLLMLLYKSGVFNWLFWLLQPVGQMAFTNYLSHSLIGALLFYGFGFGMFGSFERYEVYLIILAIMIFQIIFSHIWLRYFSMGPLEWIWRQLTYWKKLPIRNK